MHWASGGKIIEDKTQEDAAAFGIELPKPKSRSLRTLRYGMKTGTL